MTLGEVIKRERTKAGLNLPELAEKAGISYTALLVAEKNQRNTRMSTVVKIAAALNLSLDAIADEIDLYPEEEMESTE